MKTFLNIHEIKLVNKYGLSKDLQENIYEDLEHKYSWNQAGKKDVFDTRLSKMLTVKALCQFEDQASSTCKPKYKRPVSFSF